MRFMGLQSEKKGRNMVTRLSAKVGTLKLNFKLEWSSGHISTESQLTAMRTMLRYVVVK
jgi:hypothetical protein